MRWPFKLLLALLLAILAGGIALKFQNENEHAQITSQQDAQDRLEQAKENARQLEKFVSNHQIAIGMTKAQVEQAWNKPQTINTTTTDAGSEEQWVYSSSYVYFDTRGIVRAIQQTQAPR